MRYAIIAGIPLTAAAWFVDHRAAGVVGIAAILLTFIGVVWDLGR